MALKAPTLTSLAKAAKDELEAAFDSSEKNYVKAGEALREAKDICKDRDETFGVWVRKNVGITPQWANTLIRIADGTLSYADYAADNRKRAKEQRAKVKASKSSINAVLASLIQQIPEKDRKGLKLTPLPQRVTPQALLDRAGKLVAIAAALEAQAKDMSRPVKLTAAKQTRREKLLAQRSGATKKAA